MNHLFNLLFITVLLLNLLGLALVTVQYTGLTPGLAKSASVLAICLVFFCLEHFVGLGALGWLLPFCTVGALWVIWKEHRLLLENPWGELAFLAGFGYALLWRYTYPDLDASSEKLADLEFVASYMTGARLPAPDLWLHPYTLTQYYAFQHYSAGLMGRFLNVSCGTAYNVAYCVATGLVLAPACDFVRFFTTSRARQILVLAALLVGGTGACLITPFTVKNEQTFSSMRFVGSADAEDDSVLTPFGIALRKMEYGAAPIDAARHETILEMPMEIFSYVVHLGDYHAPLGGYVLLATALAAFGLLLGKPEAVPRRWATGVLTGTAPLCIFTNTWTFPFQSMLVAGCLVFLWCYRERPRWEELIGTSLIPWLLLYPAFTYFLSRTIGASMKIELVGPGQHAPVLSYLLQMWPVLGLVVLAWFAAGKGRKEYRWFAVVVAFLLVLMETINIDDIYSGRFERFNTTLKWWPWVGMLSFLLLAPLNLADATKSKVARLGTIVILLGSLVFAVMLGREFLRRPRTAVGQLDGAAWLRQAGQDPRSPQNLTINGSILNYLGARPGGVTLETVVPNRMSFVETGAISLFTGHPTVVGWAAHEQLWRGYQRDIEQRWNRANEFFRGQLPSALDFLAEQDVRFILWPGSQDVDPTLFQKIQGQIGSRYFFVRFDEGQPLKGIWERKEWVNK